MTERIQRNESTPNGRRIWEAVDRGAERAPQKVKDRLAHQALYRDIRTTIGALLNVAMPDASQESIDIAIDEMLPSLKKLTGGRE